MLIRQPALLRTRPAAKASISRRRMAHLPGWSRHKGPKSLGGSGVSLMLYVESVDAAFAKAVEAGATVARPVQDQFWGDRMGTLTDPYGHVWSLATHVEDVSAEECGRRAEAFM